MASLAQPLPNSDALFPWLWKFLKDELAPYKGRAGLVTRMVAASALVMIVCMTFRIPYAWQAAVYALLVSRDTPQATLQSAAIVFGVTGLGTAYLIVSMRLVVNILPLHFLWIIATLFLAFYAIGTLTNYLAAVAFVNTISVGIPLWDRHVSAETNVEDTLWLLLATLIAVAVTGAVELAFVRQRPGDEILLPMTERLSAVEQLLSGYAEGHAPDAGDERKIKQLAMLGTSMFRQLLRRSNIPPQYSAGAGGAVVLIGRLVDLAANLTQLRFESSANDRKRFRGLASTLANIRNDLVNREMPAAFQFDAETEPAAVAPLLGEMERTVKLITEVFGCTQPGCESVPSPDLPGRPKLLSRDAFLDPRHLHFALKGCLAASLCYVIYKALAWPEISTAVTTCLLTALSTIGASRQKQMLRFAGAITGGFVIGMGSQMFILPYLDSIGGFLLLFVLVTALSSWFMTSSPRLSYFGVQMALAFYLINLQEFRIQTSLTVARDRVVGILLGLFMMWFVFDRLWTSPASVEMKRTFVSNLRLMAQFARVPLSKDPGVAFGRSLALRETINANLDKVRAVADGVLFEFGPSRQRDLKFRSYIRQCQPQLRSLFIMRIAFLKYRLQLPGFELPEPVRAGQQAYDEHAARMLEEIADRIERDAPFDRNTVEDSRALLNRTIEAIHGEQPALIALLRGIDALTAGLATEIAGEVWRTV